MIDRMTISEHSIPTFADEIVWDDHNNIKERYDALIYARLLCNQEQLRVLKHARKKGRRVGLASLSINVSLHEGMLTMTRPASVQGVDKTMVALYRPQAEGVGNAYYYLVTDADAPLAPAFVDFVEIATQYPAPAVETLSDELVREAVTRFSSGTLKQVEPNDNYYRGYRTVSSDRGWRTNEELNLALLSTRFSDKDLCEALEFLKHEATPAEEMQEQQSSQLVERLHRFNTFRKHTG